MPFVKGFLRIRRRGQPDIGLPDPEGEIDPDFGLEELPPGLGGGPIIPEPPPGIWPPLTPEMPWRPIDPSWGVGRPPLPDGGLPERPGRPERPTDPGYGIEGPEEPETLPPGTLWPPLPPGVSGKFLALVLIGSGRGVHYRYVVVDASLRPGLPLPPKPEVPEPK